MLLCWSPSKALAYFAPILAILWYMWVAHSRGARRRGLWWIVGWITLIGAYWALSRRFDVTPAVLAVLTYGTFAALYVIPNRGLGSTRLLGRMLRLVALVMVIEATFGILQAAAGAARTGTFDWSNGDVVQGTIYPMLVSSHAFANPMFAANMAFMFLGLLPVAAQGKKWRGAVLLGIAAFVLASVVHAILFLAAALVAGFVLCRPKLKAVRGKTFLVTALCALPILAYVFLSSNLALFVPLVERALAGESPRAIVVLESATVIPRQYPLMPLVGFGPGQFSSRAALLASGIFLGRSGRSLPLIKAQSSPEFSEYLAKLVNLARDPTYRGSSQEPFFSWLSVYTEFGLPCLIALFCWVAVILWRARRAALKKNQRLLGTAVVAGVVFFVLLGLQENYWEVPQAVLVGTLLLKVMYANLVGDGALPSRVVSGNKLSPSGNGPGADLQPA